MFKLIDLLEVGDIVKVKTTQTGVDPETGKISWDVEYYVDFKEVIKKLEEIIIDFHKARKMRKVDDAKIIEIMNTVKSAKTALIKRLNEIDPSLLGE